LNSIEGSYWKLVVNKEKVSLYKEKLKKAKVNLEEISD
jgi:hypothetical protein